jgi:hypothetical protein
VTGEHRRHLATSVRYIEQLLDVADRFATADIAGALQAVRRELRDFGARFQLELRVPAIDPLHAIRVQLSVASNSIAEMRSRAMRGYGPLAEGEARELDASCDVLESAIARAQDVLDAV